MALFKLKTMATAVLMACAIGFSVFAASGAGTGDGDKPGAGSTAQPGKASLPAPGVKQGQPPATRKGPRVERARQELQVLLAELEAREAAGKGNLDAETRARLRARLEVIDRLLDPDDGAFEEKPPAKPVTDRDRLQGTWRVTAIVEGDKTTPTKPEDPWFIEVSSSTLKMPYKDASGGWKQREYKIAVDAS